MAAALWVARRQRWYGCYAEIFLKNSTKIGQADAVVANGKFFDVSIFVFPKLFEFKPVTSLAAIYATLPDPIEAAGR